MIGIFDKELFSIDSFDLLQNTSYKSLTLDQLKFTFHAMRWDDNTGHEVLPHMHDFFEFHYITEGGVQTSINGMPLLCESGQFYIIPPMSLHRHAPSRSSGYYKGFAMHWSINRVDIAQPNNDLERIKTCLKDVAAVVFDDTNAQLGCVSKMRQLQVRADFSSFQGRKPKT